MIKIEDLKEIKALKDVEELEVNTYVSVTKKTMMIEALVNVLVKKDEFGVYAVNSLEKEVKSKMAAIAIFTNIELTDDDYLNYDILFTNNLYNQISYKCLDDIKRFFDMLDARIEDKLSENSMNNILAERTSEVVDLIDRCMWHLEGMLDKGDPNIIAKYLSKGVEAIAQKLPDFSQLDIMKGLNKNGVE